MQTKESMNEAPSNKIVTWLATTVGRIVIALIVPIATFLVLWQGYIFLRDTQAPQLIIVLVAIVWGVGGVGLLFFVTNWLVEQLPKDWTRRLQPFVFIGPGVAILAWYLAIPTIRTLLLSFQDESSRTYVGFENYLFAFTDRIMLETFRNNLLWMIFGTLFCVSLGLVIAVLADRSRFENIYKAIIFTPMAISFVGAGVIWKFVYTYKGEGSGISEIGLLNAVVSAFGGADPALAAYPTVEQLLIDCYYGVAADRLCHGNLFLCHQGRTLRIDGSRPHGWCR